MDSFETQWTHPLILEVLFFQQVDITYVLNGDLGNVLGLDISELDLNQDFNGGLSLPEPPNTVLYIAPGYIWRKAILLCIYRLIYIVVNPINFKQMP